MNVYQNNTLINPKTIENFVTNPNFRINQKGETEYRSNNYSVKYFVDRWQVKGNCLLQINKNNIAFTKTSEANDSYAVIMQTIEDYYELEGKPLTLSVEFVDENNIATLAIVKIKAGWVYKDEDYELARTWSFQYVISSVHTLPNKMLRIYIHIAKTAPLNFKCSIRNVKLELGLYATPFLFPNYDLELLKCKQYFQIITGIYSIDAYRSDCILAYIRFRQHMRIAPTLSFKTNIFNSLSPKGVCVINSYGNPYDGFEYMLGRSTVTSGKEEFSIKAINTSIEIEKFNSFIVIGTDNPVYADSEIY